MPACASNLSPAPTLALGWDPELARLWAIGQTGQAATAAAGRAAARVAPGAAHMMPRVRTGMVEMNTRRVAGFRRIWRSPIAPRRPVAPRPRSAPPGPGPRPRELLRRRRHDAGAGWWEGGSEGARAARSPFSVWPGAARISWARLRAQYWGSVLGPAVPGPRARATWDHHIPHPPRRRNLRPRPPQVPAPALRSWTAPSIRALHSASTAPPTPASRR